MSDTMSSAAIEALFAQNAGSSGVSAEPSRDDAAAAADVEGLAAEVSPDEALPQASPDAEFALGGAVDDAPEPAPQERSAPAPGFAGDSSEAEAAQAPVVSVVDAVLTDTAAAHAESTAHDAASEQAEPDHASDPAADAAGSASHTTIAALFAQYGKYVALFVGAGLISGSVVHFPMAPVRYALIGAVGALVFAVASVVSELGDRDPLRLLRVALSSLALAVGIGMMSGGIQHFMDIPGRAAVLIPLGAVLSLAAFAIRHGLRLRRIDLALIVPWLIIAVFALGFGLSKLAGVAAAQGGGGGHGHGSEATDGHGAGASGEDAAHGGESGDGDDAHGIDGAADDAHAAEDAHAEDDGHAEEDAHGAEDAHAEDAHAADDSHAEETAEQAEAGGGKSAGKRRSIGHGGGADEERIVLVP